MVRNGGIGDVCLEREFFLAIWDVLAVCTISISQFGGSES